MKWTVRLLAGPVNSATAVCSRAQEHEAQLGILRQRFVRSGRVQHRLRPILGSPGKLERTSFVQAFALRLAVMVAKIMRGDLVYDAAIWEVVHLAPTAAHETL